MTEVRLTPQDRSNPGVRLLEKGYEDAPQGSAFVGAWLARIGGKRYSVVLTRDNVAEPVEVPDVRWHMSISADDGVPAWNALAAIAHEVRPGVPFAIGVPPKSWWINVHPGTLHLYELRDENLVAQWRFERRGDDPS